MGRSLVRVCLWAVVLLVYMKEYHANASDYPGDKPPPNPAAMPTQTSSEPVSTKDKPPPNPAAMPTQTSSEPVSTKDICSEEVIQECRKKQKTCKVKDGNSTCVCPPKMKENDHGDCFIAKTVTIKFRVKKRSTTYREEPNCDDELIQQLKNMVEDIIEETIVCNGDEVSFQAFAETADKEEKINNAFRNCGQRCDIGANSRIEPDSVKVTATNFCTDEEYKQRIDEMGMVCEYNETTSILCNKEKATVIGKASVQGIPIEICKALPCSQTCIKDDKRHCVLESCVCKPQYKVHNGECTSICSFTNPSVCPSGATCVEGLGDQSFYCDCPPKLTGPLCQRENKPLQTAKLNIVVVGVVLASLLLLCFVVSASIISRLRKKAQGPSFSKDCERRPQRELHGYDGPYKASDPASLHRSRDHTSL